MNKGALSDWLAAQEVQQRHQFNGIPTAPHGAWVDGKQHLLQFYAVHHCDVEPRISKVDCVVLAIGANFTQRPLDEGNQQKLREQLRQACITDNLKQWRNNAIQAIATFNEHQKVWQMRGWCSKPPPILTSPRNFVFIMTNLCPWISTATWSEMDRQVADEMLKASNGFAHIPALLRHLGAEGCPVQVIAHGINRNIKLHLLEAMKTHVRQDWFLFANLTYRWSWDGSRFLLAKKSESSELAKPTTQ